jgi:hypothetical protein
VVEVARFIIERSLLPGGRFEAHEFGRRQHSSASAGGLLIGLSGIRALPDDLIVPVVDKAAAIILPDGRVRGHDSDRQAGDTTWSPLLGEDLTSFLQRTYANESRFVIVLVSAAFLASRWAGNWEWRAVLARMQRQQTGYVLPYVLEEIDLPGLNPTLGYVSATDFSPESFAELVIRKVRSQLS